MTGRIETPGAREMYSAMTMKMEQYVKLYVKPRPRWLPERLYRALMSRVVLYESLPVVTLLPEHLAEKKRTDAMSAKEDV
jgi:hypothetical protein